MFQVLNKAGAQDRAGVERPPSAPWPSGDDGAELIFLSVDRLGVHRLDETTLVRDHSNTHNNSLSQAPLCPCRPNFNSVGWVASFCLAVIVVRRSPMRTDGGSSLPRYACRPGLYSNRSAWDGAPNWVR